MTQAQQLSESLLFGWPNILVPHADSFDSVDDMQLNEQSLAGLCQVLHHLTHHLQCMQAHVSVFPVPGISL